MIGIDYGSSAVKWFDGKNFGVGIPEGRSFTVGISSSQVLVRESFYPLCSGSKLKKLILNDVSADLSVEPEQLSIAYCKQEKLENGCRFFVFVESREGIENIPEEILSKSQVTVDVLGGVAGILSLREDTFTLVDAGNKKIAIVNVEGGKIENIEIFRGGFKYHLSSGEVFSYIKEVAKKKVFLIGGGALSEEFRSKLSGLTPFTVPRIEPFGEETPLYINAYGLYNFRKSPCKAFFKSFVLLSEDLLKDKKKLLFTGTATFFSLLAITGGLFTSYVSARRDYFLEKRTVNRELSKVLGEKVLAPEIQIPQKLNHYRELAKFLKVNTPPLLYYIDGISRSVVSGVKVLALDGSLSSGQFTVKGRAKDSEALKKFTENLKHYFRRVSVSSTKESKVGISFTLRAEVKGGSE